MSFANKYLEKNFGDFLFVAPEEFPKIEFWVVIPCFNEFNLNETFHSLFNCQEPQNQIGVVVVVNDSEKTSIEIKVQNKRTLVEIDKLKNQSPEWLTIHSIYVESLPEKHAGVGWARKIGMDWVISHFNKTNNKNGIILSLDADTTVEANYFCETQSYFETHPKSVAATVYFEHRIENNAQIEGILLYELYMRYYKNALEYCNFPHSIYTVGSAFAVRASAYVAQGGMNRRKAGEDFYFLHKLMPLGKVGEINSTSVFPSSRLSDRVPFGTGPALKKHQEGSNDLNY
jgi:glycosyltransferase involved in cell wall biosynthesis